MYYKLKDKMKAHGIKVPMRYPREVLEEFLHGSSRSYEDRLIKAYNKHILNICLLALDTKYPKYSENILKRIVKEGK